MRTSRPGTGNHATGLLIGCLLLALSGCGGGGDSGGGPTDSTPSISNLQYSPTSVLQFESDGVVPVMGTFDFHDKGGDLASLHLTTSQGNTITEPIAGVTGLKSGTIQGSFEVDTTVLGHFTFEAYVTDSGGRRSNSLSGTFDVTVNDTASHWTTRPLPTPSGSSISLSRVRWSGSQFVAVGSSVYTSPDAITWTERQTGVSTTLNDAAWSGTQFVAVGEAGVVLTSHDGASWNLQPIPSTSSPSLQGVAASSSRYVAVGTDDRVPGVTSAGLILTSVDGLKWDTVPQALASRLYAVVWSGTKFVAVGLSPDPSYKTIALVSADGLAWTSHPIGDYTFPPRDIAWSGSEFVAVGTGSARSPDGISWTVTGAAGGASIGSNYAIGWSGKRFLTCNSDHCFTSPDGVEWTYYSFPSLTARGMAWGGTRWVAVGDAPYVLTSP